MLWIKRNLIFVIAMAIAVVLVGVAVFNLLGKGDEDTTINESLAEQTVRLKEMYDRPVFPSPENINAAEADRSRIVAFKTRSQRYFATIAPVNVGSAQAFKTALDNAIVRFNKSAAEAGVLVRTNGFAYSFEGLMSRIDFARESIQPLAAQLAEIDKILEVLFAAKVNSLDSIQRARVAVEDGGPSSSSTSYVAESVTTNSLGAIHPYRINIRCFSPELADVMENLMKSPHGFLIKTIDVEPASAEMGGAPPPGGMMPPGFMPPPMNRPRRPGFGGGAPGGQQRAVPFAPSKAPVPGSHTGLATMLSEKPFRVSIYLHVVNMRLEAKR